MEPLAPGWAAGESWVDVSPEDCVTLKCYYAHPQSALAPLCAN